MTQHRIKFFKKHHIYVVAGLVVVVGAILLATTNLYAGGVACNWDTTTDACCTGGFHNACTIVDPYYSFCRGVMAPIGMCL